MEGIHFLIALAVILIPAACSDVDECTLDIDDCDTNAICVNSNTEGGFSCVCNSGFTFVGADGRTCEDINECTDDTDNCDINAQCNNTIGNFTCMCNAGYRGDGVNSCTECNQNVEYGIGCSENCSCVEPVSNDVMCNRADGMCTCNDDEFPMKACDKNDLAVTLTSVDPPLHTDKVDNATLRCTVNLHSRDLVLPVTITYPDGTMMDASMTSEGVYELLLINIISPDSNGIYTCTAKTMIDAKEINKSGELDLDVLAPGRIISLTESVQGELGKSVTLDCIVFAKPAPIIRWYDYNSAEIIPDNVKYTVTTTNLTMNEKRSSLTVDTLQRIDNGTYKCETQTEVITFRDTEFADILVIEKPEVGNVMAVPLIPLALDVSWSVTFKGNLPFTCKVDYSVAGSNDWQVSTPGLDEMVTNHQVTSLVAYTFYTVRVICNNDVGDSLAALLVPLVRTQQGEPSEPLDVRVIDSTSETLTVEWDEPETKRGIIAFYEVLSTDIETGMGRTYNTSRIADSAPTNLSVPRLEPFRNYSLVVTAYNVQDGNDLRGNPSAEIMKRTAEAAPTPPLNVVLRNEGEQCVVTWERPANENGIILSYTVSHIAYKYPTSGSSDDEDLILDDSKSSKVLGITTRSYSIAKIELAPYARFRFAINASTSAGFGERSEETNITCDSPPATPLTPPKPKVPDNADGSKDLVTSSSFWMNLDPASDRNGPIRCYEIIVVDLLEEETIDGRNPHTAYPASSIVSYDEAHKTPHVAYVALANNGKNLTTDQNVQIGVSRVSRCDGNPSQRKKRQAPISDHYGENGPLKMSTRYTAFVRAYVDLTDGTEAYSSSPLMTPITTDATNISPAVIVVICVVIVIVIVIVLALVFIMRARRSSKLQQTIAGQEMLSVDENVGVAEQSSYEPVGVGASSLCVQPSPMKDVTQESEQTTPLGYEEVGVNEASQYEPVDIDESSPCAHTYLTNDITQENENCSLDYDDSDVGEPSPKNPVGTGGSSPFIFENIGIPSWAQHWRIPWESMIVGDKILGEGSFGEVRDGAVMIKGEVPKAAIKKLKKNTSFIERQNFMDEFRTMTKIGRHPNVVSMLGSCVHGGVLYVALEYLPNGDLQSYLRNIPSDASETSLTAEKMFQFALDVAKGMHHLATSRTRVPARWLSPESLTRHIYTIKSDVWSFGILLWEIATLGGVPYPGIKIQFLTPSLQNGYRMAKPNNCSGKIFLSFRQDCL